jgi:hypothetical protein
VHQPSVYHWFYSVTGPSSKEDGCSLSSTVDGSGVWQVLLVWSWARPSWKTLYTRAPTKCVQLILFWNRSILLCFPPVYLQKLLWLRPSWTTLYTHCTHVQQLQLMMLSRVVMYSTVQPGASLASFVAWPIWKFGTALQIYKSTDRPSTTHTQHHALSCCVKMLDWRRISPQPTQKPDLINFEGTFKHYRLLKLPARNCCVLPFLSCSWHKSLTQQVILADVNEK